MVERLTSLPDPIRQVTIMETFSVSQIVAADECFLKVLVTRQEDGVVPLPPNPFAELGKVFHSLLEEAVRGLFDEEVVSQKGIEKVLDRLMKETHGRLEKDPRTASFADLTRTMTILEWERKRRSIIDVALEFVDNVRHGELTSHGARNKRFCFEDAQGDGRWVEVPIDVPDLRLKGRIDVLERKGGEIKILDLKSGRSQDSSGEIRPKIALQLRLYGIMAKVLDPRARVTLVVNNGEEHLIPFDSTVCTETMAWLRSTMGSLIPGSIITADKCARVGPDCLWCGIRHRCERYFREVPNLWDREVEWRLPLDTWGTVERLESNNFGLVNLTLLDGGNRRVKIFRVRKARLEGLNVGGRVWFFDLAASRPTFRGRMWRHPLNFHEIDDSDDTNRAWSLKVFAGKS